jgi:predicted ArsR family transcriptional regulator
MNIDKQSIRHRALLLISMDGRGIAAQLSKEFGLSRQVANGYLQTLAREGLIDAEGTTRARA